MPSTKVSVSSLKVKSIVKMKILTPTLTQALFITTVLTMTKLITSMKPKNKLITDMKFKRNLERELSELLSDALTINARK